MDEKKEHKKNEVTFRGEEDVTVIDKRNSAEIRNRIGGGKPVTVRAKKGFHINLVTGELIPDKQYDSRGDNLYNLRKSLRELGDIIETNYESPHKTRMYVFSYREKQPDNGVMFQNHKAFFKKYKAAFGGYGEIQYIGVPELYGDLAGYHLNTIYYFETNLPPRFPAIEEVQKLWPHGDITVRQPRNIKAIRSYLTPHICTVVTKKNIKMHEKAERLMSMPPSKKLYTSSRGIMRPEKTVTTYAKGEKRLEEKGFFENKRAAVTYPTPLINSAGDPIMVKRKFYNKPPQKPKGKE
ncbi:MAG: hypothetical protein FWD58_06380 [Firmicutes bacterium]|nr:hypothetical protein [Bacillota bacterium]